MYEDSYLDSYWEDQYEPYYGEDFDLYEERQLDFDRALESYEEYMDSYYEQ